MVITAQDAKLKKGYKETEVGTIPEEWEVNSLDEITDPKKLICYGIVQVGPFTSNGVPVLAIKNLNTDYFTNVHESSPNVEALYARSRVCPGDVLISVKGTTGRIGIVPEYFYGNISRDIARMRLTDRDVPEFWFQMLQSEAAQRRMSVATVGTTRMELSIGILKQIKMPRPPKLEQHAIASVLSDVDALIEHLEKLITKKKAIKQATMQQLLTGKMRLPGFSGEWEVMKLEDVADKNIQWSITGGPFGSNLKTVDYVNDGVRIIQLQNIGDGVFYDDYKIYTSEEKADELISCNIYPGEIIMSKMGDPVARACILPVGDRRYLMASDGIRLVVNKKRFNTQFIHDYINSIYFRKKAIEASTGSTRQRIGLEDLRKLPLVVPTLYEQRAIATILSDMDAEITTLEQKRDKTRALKQGMMQELLTGKTRLI